ncbi:MAG: 4Fe-4S binding protein [Chloroflexi bacterium]|nr:4Fe-4S binding protein [Chloroflexota bacterium]
MAKTDEAYIKLAEKNGVPDAKGAREILHEILKLAMTPDEARFLAELPASNADLAAKYHTAEKAIEEKILGLARRGLVLRSRRGDRYPTSLGNLHDNILASHPKYIPLGITRLWMDLYEAGWWKYIADGLANLPVRSMRVGLPLKTAPAHVKLLPCEDLEQIILAHKYLISIRNCCCRVGNQGIPNSDCQHPIFTCTQFGSRAESDLFRGSGKKVSADEAITVSLRATRAGLVPTLTNVSVIEGLEFICYCCGDGCLTLNPLIRDGNVLKALAPSRFLVEVDNAVCNGCEACLPVCYFDAIEMKNVPGFNEPKAVINADKCLGCGLCVLRCGVGAMRMELVRPPEFIPPNLRGQTPIIHQ